MPYEKCPHKRAHDLFPAVDTTVPKMFSLTSGKFVRRSEIRRRGLRAYFKRVFYTLCVLVFEKTMCNSLKSSVLNDSIEITMIRPNSFHSVKILKVQKKMKKTGGMFRYINRNGCIFDALCSINFSIYPFLIHQFSMNLTSFIHHFYIRYINFTSFMECCNYNYVSRPHNI